MKANTVSFPLAFLEYKTLWHFQLLGPDHWGAVCNAGKAQSPIDIPASNVQEAKYNPFTFLGYDKEFKGTTLANNGHTVQMGFDLGKGQLAPTVFDRPLCRNCNLSFNHARSLAVVWRAPMNSPSFICIGAQKTPKDLNTLLAK